MDQNHDVPRWFHVQTVPETHIFPTEDRPGNEQIPICQTVPIIDLGGKSSSQKLDTIHKIMRASQEFGFFQVTNHGVAEDVMREAGEVLEELFGFRADDISEEARENGWIYMGSTSFAAKGAHLWRDNLKHSCHPLEQSMQNWPQNPKRYRDVMGAYIVAIRRLSSRILEMISQGLGLEKGYLGGMGRVQFLTASTYPPCPDPSLTLGLLKHLDHSLITILFQLGNGGGLQVLKDGKWIGVEVVPYAFVINIGTQIEIISNGKLRSPEHRVVTSKEGGRTSIACFVNPNPDCIIEPAKVLVNEANIPHSLYPSFKDFVKASNPFGPFTNLLQHGVS